MFAVIPEDHELCHKRKPRLPQSQGVSTGTNTDSLRLAVTKPTNISFSPVLLLDYRRVAKTLTLAFDKDPFVNYILNTKTEYPAEDTRQIKRKHDLMLSFFEYSAYECLSLGGLILVIKDNNLELDLIQQRLKALALATVPFLGVACWNKLVFDRDENMFDYPFSSSLLANIHPSSLKFNLFSSLAKCRLKVLKSALPRLEDVRTTVLSQLMTSSELKQADSVWYLGDVGILPSMQGHGLAKRLVNHCVENYMAGHWCYLESSNLANRKFYEKLGWTLKKTFVVNDDDSDYDSDSSSGSSRSRRRKSSSVSVDDLLYMDAFVFFSEA